jgi:hypothetical protein
VPFIARYRKEATGHAKGYNRAVKRWMLGTLQGSTVHKYPMIISTNSSSASGNFLNLGHRQPVL